jgi:hypothetical protein
VNDREITPYQRIAELERENVALGQKLDSILSDPKYEGGVQYWISRHDKLLAENAALRLTLNEAATSLCTISQQAGRTDELREMSQIRGYAFSRYSAAIDAARKEQ